MTLLRATAVGLALATLAAVPEPLEGQQQVLQVGVVAPDFELPGATRYGVLSSPVRLSEFRGMTVVLSFFYRARTPG
jgi:hypothetical protein